MSANYLESINNFEEAVHLASEDVQTYSSVIDVPFSIPVGLDYDTNDIRRKLSAYANWLMLVSMKTNVRQREKSESNLSFKEAKSFLQSIVPQSNHFVPCDFNGMRDEVNPKYL